VLVFIEAVTKDGKLMVNAVPEVVQASIIVCGVAINYDAEFGRHPYILDKTIGNMPNLVGVYPSRSAIPLTNDIHGLHQFLTFTHVHYLTTGFH
jgi:hypothetical protein